MIEHNETFSLNFFPGLLVSGNLACDVFGCVPIRVEIGASRGPCAEQ
jgi:hypothetical protein